MDCKKLQMAEVLNELSLVSKDLSMKLMMISAKLKADEESLGKDRHHRRHERPERLASKPVVMTRSSKEKGIEMMHALAAISKTSRELAIRLAVMLARADVENEAKKGCGDGRHA